MGAIGWLYGIPLLSFLDVTTSARWPGGRLIPVESVFLGVLVYGFTFSSFPFFGDWCAVLPDI